MDHEEQLRGLYRAFNDRETDTVLAQLAPEVEWPNGWEGGWVRGVEAVRGYWTRQWAEIDPHVEPTAITPLDAERVRVHVHQVVRDLTGNVVADGQVAHVYTFDDDGLVARMEIEG